MSLGAVKKHKSDELDSNRQIGALVGREEHFVDWIEHPTSDIVHHEAQCCEDARAWFMAYARSMEIGNFAQYQLRAPTWLSQRFVWGPSEWPISWCQLVKKHVVDCGVFAVLAREIFRAQGHQAHPAQVLLTYNPSCTGHWRDLWQKGEERRKKRLEKEQRAKSGKELVSSGGNLESTKQGKIFPWIGTDIVYHETCVVEMSDGSAKLYDATWGNWYEPLRRDGYASIIAFRTDCPRLLRWGDRNISCGEWIIL